MAIKFLKNADIWTLTAETRFDLRDELPPGNYSVNRNPLTGDYYLEQTKDFDLPKRLYGKTDVWTKRVLSAFQFAGDHQTGVLLSGLKGSGKTLLAKNIAATSGLPVIIVNNPFCDDRFLRTIQNIEQRAVIMFDEFEKLYDKESQEKILTLFDGVYTAKNKIMILTCNDRWAVGTFFHNRPGRLLYAINFEGLDSKFIREYCQDNLVDTSYTDDIIKTAIGCGDFNFDMLQAVVRELNRFGGTMEDLVEILNVKPLHLSKPKWKAKLVSPDHPGLILTVNETLAANPIKLFQQRNDEYFTLYVRADGNLSDGRAVDSNDTNYCQVRLTDLRGVDPINDTYHFEVSFPVDLSVPTDDDGDDGVNVNVRAKVVFMEEKPSTIYGGGAWHVHDAF